MAVDDTHGPLDHSTGPTPARQAGPPMPSTPETVLEMLAPGLWWLHTGAANTYLWVTADGVVVVDPGLPGNEDQVLRAVAQLTAGAEAPVMGTVLTHWHADHSGAAAGLAQATGAPVFAGGPDAAVLTGNAAPTPPDLTAEEAPLYAAIVAGGAFMDPPRLPQVQALATGDALPGPGAGTVLVVGGHTAGSLAVHLPGVGAVLTGDVAGRSRTGGVTAGLFHVDRDQARRALHELAALNPSIAGVGHGQPLRREAGTLLAHAARSS